MRTITIPEERALSKPPHKVTLQNIPHHVTKTKQLITALARANTIEILYTLNESPKTWTELLEEFGMTKKRSGYLGHFIRKCNIQGMVSKDETTRVYYLTFKGRKCVEYLDLLRPLANLSISTPELPPTPDQLNLDIARPWLESLLEKEIRKVARPRRGL